MDKRSEYVTIPKSRVRVIIWLNVIAALCSLSAAIMSIANIVWL